MIILVLNCGSSSLKYQLLDMKNDNVYDLLAKGLVERIGMEMGCLKHQASGKQKIEREMPIADHTVGIKAVLEALLDKEVGVLNSLEDIEAVGHRVVHGGEEFFCSALVTDKVVEGIRKCCEVAPLHNPANLLGIEAVNAALPSVPQVAVFDTAFHQTMPDYAYLYALPYTYYEKYRVRRYGFHGTSHKYVSAKGAEFAGIDLNNSKIITCHLGNGSSVTAVQNGKSVDTSMGFTPLAGITMSSRSGDVDPSVLAYIMKKEHINMSQMIDILNHKSGLLGISEISPDMRDLRDDMSRLNNDQKKKADLARNIFINRICRYIGAYIMEMGGVDGIIFTAGVGEHDFGVRAKVMNALNFMGVIPDEERNKANKAGLITRPDSKIAVMLIPTNEELMIERDVVKVADLK